MLGPNREGHRHADFQGHRQGHRVHRRRSGTSTVSRHRCATGVKPDTDVDAAGELTIDCDCCTLRHTDACDDCVVSFLLEREPEDAVVIDADEARAMRMLERAGLVPTLRFSSRAG